MRRSKKQRQWKLRDKLRALLTRNSSEAATNPTQPEQQEIVETLPLADMGIHEHVPRVSSESSELSQNGTKTIRLVNPPASSGEPNPETVVEDDRDSLVDGYPGRILQSGRWRASAKIDGLIGGERSSLKKQDTSVGPVSKDGDDQGLAGFGGDSDTPSMNTFSSSKKDIASASEKVCHSEALAGKSTLMRDAHAIQKAKDNAEVKKNGSAHRHSGSKAEQSNGRRDLDSPIKLWRDWTQRNDMFEIAETSSSVKGSIRSESRRPSLERTAESNIVPMAHSKAEMLQKATPDSNGALTSREDRPDNSQRVDLAFIPRPSKIPRRNQSTVRARFRRPLEVVTKHGAAGKAYLERVLNKKERLAGNNPVGVDQEQQLQHHDTSLQFKDADSGSGLDI
ncbi:hypothetical protein L228DRAFT_280549 [Xylona heveae TC161]|uniref:Uncharacterized protein n=1 Tax=Xylona heveae (strain CBS 132557 / TC161) TaxID=1328760 RepID=A0A165IRX9_XYLHT|nr:hypothetical protein L228DRAFT_280549 [Xylona heveae TC161]KZF25298.1 hypothetical protein L228DRAFT_280549 [Xylona heveae TC161]